jgi:hypothetical protein
VLRDELVQVVENLALPLGQWKHGATIRKRKAKVKNGRAVGRMGRRGRIGRSGGKGRKGSRGRKG